MACVDCTEFLVQGSGTVGAGSAFSYEKVIIAEDPDNIPLVLLSVKALDKDGVLLVDQTPAWLEATTSGASILVGGKLVYRLTVTVEIDAVRVLDPEVGDPSEWGAGTYTIELRAQVEDASKPVIVCLFDVCITGTIDAFPNLFLLEVNNLTAGDIEAWDKNLGTFIDNRRSVTAAQNLRGCALDANNSLILFTKRDGGNNSFLYSMPLDGSSETNEGAITFGQGAAPRTLVHDDDALFAFITKTTMVVQVDTSGGTGNFVITQIGQTDSGKGIETAIDFDNANSLVYYGYELGAAFEIRSIAYGASTATPDTTVADDADFVAGGVTSQSTIVGLTFNPNNGLIYCANDAGELFSVVPATGATTLLVTNLQWDFFAAMSGRPRHLIYDSEKDVLWMAATRSTTDNSIFEVPIGDETNNVRRLQVSSNVNIIIEGFTLGPADSGS